MNNVFNKIRTILRTKENYVPRTNPTIGGFWTVDTYTKNGVTYQILDEGYTELLMCANPCVHFIVSGRSEPNFKTGNEEDLEKLLALVLE